MNELGLTPCVAAAVISSFCSALHLTGCDVDGLPSAYETALLWTCCRTTNSPTMELELGQCPCSRTLSPRRGIPALPRSSATTERGLMAKRGRPNKDGVKPGWMLLRWVMVLRAYGRARASGEKHSAAIAAAVSAVRSRVPGMPISETEVKRILALESKDPGRAWIISVRIVRGPELKIWLDNLRWIAEESPLKLEARHLPNYTSKLRRLRTLTIQVGPRPRYPRHNARS
jgi:hypothetical protein